MIRWPVFHRERGLALVAVMWMVAALSILAAGLSAATRSEIQVAHVSRAFAEAAAVGDAAIQIAALELQSSAGSVAKMQTRTYRFEGRSIVVDLIPVGGLIDLNHASESLLQALFVHGAGLDGTAAEALAQRVVEWRAAELPLAGEAYAAAGVAFRPRGGHFEYPEDLLQVLGLSYDVYVKIRGFITVHGGAPGVDPMAAPTGVIAVLAGGDVGLAEQIAAVRASDDPAVDLTGLNQDFFGSSFTFTYRIDAHVQTDGRSYVRTRWIDLAQPGSDGSAWRTLRVEPVVAM
jgi:general secretion pathway protein K